MTFTQYLKKTFPEKWLRYKAGIENKPCRVIEAVKFGIVMHSLQKANADYLAALRPRLSILAKAQAILTAFTHVDKPYDYDFDFATDHALVCTEVVYRSYLPAPGKVGITLDTVEIGGRKTLPANEIAAIFAREVNKQDRRMDFVYFIDTKEKDALAFVSDVQSFINSSTRPKWDFLQE